MLFKQTILTLTMIALFFFAMANAIPASREELQKPGQKVGKNVDHQIVHEHNPVTHHAKVSVESQGETKHISKAAAAGGGTSHSNRPQNLACGPGECGQDPSRPRKTSCHNCGDH